VRVLVVALCISLAAAGAASATRAAAPERCARSAAVPERIFHGDDFEFVHAAASAMYCPSDVFVQITACVQVLVDAGWADVGCRTSDRVYVGLRTPGGRGVGFSFDVPCVSGTLRTHVTGGEGLDPTKWDSATAPVACFGATPVPTPSATPDPGGTPTPDPGGTPTPDPGGTPTPDPGAAPAPERAAGPSAAASGAEAGGAVMPARDTTAPRAAVPRVHVVRTTAGAVAIPLGPPDEDCSGIVRVRAAGHTAVASIRMRRGAGALVRIVLAPATRRSLRRHGHLRASVTVALADAAGNASVEAFRLTIVT
jgi:hypothetical protein